MDWGMCCLLLGEVWSHQTSAPLSTKGNYNDLQLRHAQLYLTLHSMPLKQHSSMFSLPNSFFLVPGQSQSCITTLFQFLKGYLRPAKFRGMIWQLCHMTRPLLVAPFCQGQGQSQLQRRKYHVIMFAISLIRHFHSRRLRRYSCFPVNFRRSVKVIIVSCIAYSRIMAHRTYRKRIQIQCSTKQFIIWPIIFADSACYKKYWSSHQHSEAAAHILGSHRISHSISKTQVIGSRYKINYNYVSTKYWPE